MKLNEHIVGGASDTDRASSPVREGGPLLGPPHLAHHSAEFRSTRRARSHSRASERGQVALYAVLLFPLLMLVLALVLAVGTLEGMRTRLRAQIDMAALTATQALDVASLVEGGEPRLLPEAAAQLARDYLAQNLAASSTLLAVPPAEIAAGAVISVTNEPGIDPITGATNNAPTVSIQIEAPVRVPLLGMAGIGPVVTLTIAGSAAART